MITIQALNEYTSNPEFTDGIGQIWEFIGQHFEQAQASLPPELAMERRELSFHDQVRLLGYLSLLIAELPGDVVEIGVWKGKSLMLMNEVCNHERRIIGIDPFELPNQFEEFSYYKDLMLANALVIRGFSELSAERFYNLAPSVALLHIDGGHSRRNVVLDFLLYAPSVVSGGFIVLDDYRDFKHSPEVGPTVDLLRATGFFEGFNVLGSVHGFENSYVLQRI